MDSSGEEQIAGQQTRLTRKRPRIKNLKTTAFLGLAESLEVDQRTPLIRPQKLKPRPTKKVRDKRKMVKKSKKQNRK